MRFSEQRFSQRSKPRYTTTSKRTALIGLVTCGMLVLTPIASAEKFPLSEQKLQQEAELIVVGTIQQIRIAQVAARFDAKPGNTDWGIRVTLALDGVEKGRYLAPSIEARCFRIHTRRHRAEMIAPSGHRPIPIKGTRVRAYLKRHQGVWWALLPNGLAPLDSDAIEAPEVTALPKLVLPVGLPLNTGA